MKVRNVLATVVAMLFMSCLGECFAQSGQPTTQTRVLSDTATAKVKIETFAFQVVGTTTTQVMTGMIPVYNSLGQMIGYIPVYTTVTEDVYGYVSTGSSEVPAAAVTQTYNMMGQTYTMYQHHQATVSLPATASMYSITWWVLQPNGTYSQQ